MHYKDISIHKKILLTNFLMILIPVIVVCLMLTGLLFGFSNLTGSSSPLIRNVLLNSSNYGPTLLIKSLSNELSETQKLTPQILEIFDELEDIHLHIMIHKNNKLAYISNDYNEKAIQEEFSLIAQSDFYQEPYILWNQKGLAYSATLQNKQKDTWSITFTGNHLNLPKDSYASWERTKLIIKLSILAFGCCMILLILLLGVLLTKHLSSRILKPLAQLQQATDAIKNGDLTTPITPQSMDEVGMLCENFESMRQQLVDSKEWQSQYEQQRRDLIAGISHDLSTPLTSIQGYVNALNDGIATTPEKQQHYLDIIQSKTQQMNDLVDSLFLLSKLDSKEEVLDMQQKDLNEYLLEWQKTESPRLFDRSLTLKYHGTSSPTLVEMDTAHFLRILNNLCENSIKYRKDDKVTLDVYLIKEKETCLLSFQDDGSGVAPEEVQHLFERFYRGDPARSSKIKGNGLGLSIVRHIVEQMHGHIWAQGELNQGLCIYIQFPLIKEENNG